jgi:hypothetical protein
MKFRTPDRFDHRCDYGQHECRALGDAFQRHRLGIFFPTCLVSGFAFDFGWQAPYNRHLPDFPLRYAMT